MQWNWNVNPICFNIQQIKWQRQEPAGSDGEVRVDLIVSVVYDRSANMSRPTFQISLVLNDDLLCFVVELLRLIGCNEYLQGQWWKINIASRHTV